MHSVSVHAPSFATNHQQQHREERDDEETAGDATDDKPLSLAGEGEGRWSSPKRFWITARAGLDNILSSVTEQDTFNLNQGRSFVICDYGTADGSTSMNLIRNCIAYVKERRGSRQSVLVVHEDQPLNDFNTLSKTLTGSTGQPTSSYLGDSENVFSLISPISFYGQCVPDNTVHLGLCHFCLSYLSRVPCRYPVTTSRFGPSPNTEERAKYEAQAESDWQLFLGRRAAELAPGGQLVLVTSINDPQYNDKPNQEILLLECWKQLAAEEIISEGEYAELCLPFYRRTEEEFRKPFADESSSVYRAGLRLVTLETYAHCVGNEKLPGTGQNDDSRITEFAQHMMKITRFWCNGWFAGALSERQADDREAVLETLFDRFRRRLVEERAHCSFYIVVNMLITKVH